MNYRNLGLTGLKVSELGMGCSSIGNSVFNSGSEDEFLRVLNYAFDHGINFFDTADTYAYGNSEILIGKAFKNKRDKVIISTKVGFLPSSLSLHGKKLIPFLGNARKLIKPLKKSFKKISRKNQDFSPGHIRQAVEKSLIRLNTDYIDVYLLHNPPEKIIREGEAFKVLEDLKAEGKIRWYGISAGCSDDAVICLNFPGISVLEVEFNLLNQEAARKLFPLLYKRHTGIVVKVPLARGVLTNSGKVKTGSFSHQVTYDPKLKAYLKKADKDINRKFLTEAAVRFILKHKEVSTLIAGTRSEDHLEENLRILAKPSLSVDELEKIFVDFSPSVSPQS